MPADPTLSGIPRLAKLVARLDSLPATANDGIRYVNTAGNRVVIPEASSSRLSATYWQVDGADAATSRYEKALALGRSSASTASKSNVIEWLPRNSAEVDRARPEQKVETPFYVDALSGPGKNRSSIGRKPRADRVEHPPHFFNGGLDRVAEIAAESPSGRR